MKIVIYNSEGNIHVFTPEQSCGMPIEAAAKRVVPAGAKYRIIDSSELPSDRVFRGAWEADFSTFDGTGGEE